MRQFHLLTIPAAKPEYCADQPQNGEGLVHLWVLALGFVVTDVLGPPVGFTGGGRRRRHHGPTGIAQVWPLTQFFSVSFFCEKSLICLEGKLMTPHQGNIILFRSSQQLPRLRLGPSNGFLSWHGALLGPSTRLVRCFRNYRDTRTPSGVSH